jgi:hypothetical protein
MPHECNDILWNGSEYGACSDTPSWEPPEPISFVCAAAILFISVAWSAPHEHVMTNQIHVIVPYRQASTWVFDDTSVGLKAEPFVSGIPEMISILVRDIAHAEQGFRLLFSAQPFPGYQAELTLLQSEYGGHWYRWDARHMQGWLCPALFKYFPEAPQRLYARAEPLS